MDAKANNLRLIRTFGISQVEYDDLLDEQDGKCAVCGREPVNRALCVDHDHKFKYLKVLTERLQSGQWRASAIGIHILHETSRIKAIQFLRKLLKTKSVRGLLCHRCNRGLQMFSDNPTALENAAAYLRRFNANFD